MSKKKNDKKKKNEDEHWNFHFLIEEFKKETDRAAVILASALIDEALTSILKSHLVPIPNATDNFFERSNAPLSTFSSKIDMVYRLGIVSARFCRDMHLIRKIRNSFAHDIYGCNFENGSVKSRVTELSKTCEIIPVYHHLIEEGNENLEEGTRGIFLFIVSTIIFNLNLILNQIKPVEPKSFIHHEQLYKDGNEMIERNLQKLKESSEEK